MTTHVPVASAGLVASAAMISRWRGSFRVTAVAKATFAFVPGGEMTLTQPVEIALADIHAAKNPMRSVRASADVCPHLERADVLFVGRAHAPGGQATPAMRVRLAIADDTRPLLDKRLEIVGERAVRPGAPPAQPTPFQNMAITYEKALGGLGRPDNPLGVGVGADAKILPNVFYADPSLVDRVAGYGPLAASWPVRKKLLRGKPRPSVEGIMELPDDFDWSYFQAAPIDQQIDALPQRAWILLEGLNPRAEMVQMRLPAAKTIAKLFGVGDDPTLPLRPDTLFIDGDAEHATVSWRGSFQVPNLEILANAWIGVAIEAPGHPATWPARPDARGASSASTPRASSSATVAIDDVAIPLRPGGSAFAGTMIIEEPVPAAATPFSGAAPPPPPAPKAPPQHSGTMILEEGLPPGPPPPPPPPPGPPAPTGRRAPGTMILEGAAPPVSHVPRSSFTGTLDGSGDSPMSAKLPFAKGTAPAERRSEPPAPLPGAPWAGGRPADRPIPVSRAPHTGTMTIDPDSDDAPTMFRQVGSPPAPPPPAAPPPAAPPPAPAPPAAEPPAPPAPHVEAPKAPEKKPFVPRRRSDAYQKAVERPSTEAAAPAPKPKPALPPKQDIGGALYRRKKP